MKISRKLALAGSTVFLVAASGHFLQRGLLASGLLGGAAPADAQLVKSTGVPAPAGEPGETDAAAQVTTLASVAPSVDLTNLAPDLPAAPIVPVFPVHNTAREPAEPVPALPETTLTETDCAPSLVLAAATGAMIAVDFFAPCDADARIVLRHAGLAVSGLTDESGHYYSQLPALAQNAEVEVRLPDGESRVADVAVPDFAGLSRVAVQWQGEDAFQLQAYEFGAGFGLPGHVSAVRPGRPETGGPGAGYLSILGDSRGDWPMLAEVYTFPRGHGLGDGAVTLDIEAAVTETTCGREILGETLHAGPSGVVATELTMAMPDCDAVGEYLVLQDPIPAMRVAAK